ncbi:SGNH/GDSL hydrolase family protein [Hymenobacter sp. BT175]|uniref:SGNH/GDSL hydrolase family protein n=1 Tax=Hymenobacter translucens TaxID=2886507 RepID=UPI001D0EB880|nr:SGNH/GDSL hydrolase family protein [Hymenobacter translucens]MCC2546873.1 SGNH/GDSL hydrolase family protein [Hymenobacter translucens]
MRILLFFLWLLTACTTPAADPGTPANPNSSASNFLALGDSYTIGEGVGEADRWGVQLARQLQTEKITTPDIIARTGWTTAELLSAIQAANLQKTYELVSLQIGVNNQFRGQSVATYQTEFRQLLQLAVLRAGGRPRRVFVLSIPDWGRTPYAQGRDQTRISTEIDQFNAVARQECQQAGVAFVDITPLTRAAAGDATQFTADRLHYSGRHMQQWVQQALPVVQALLK